MWTKIRWLAVLTLTVAVALLVYTAYAHYQDDDWDKTVSGIDLWQGVAMDVDHSDHTMWGSTVTWASATLQQLYARNVGGEYC